MKPTIASVIAGAAEAAARTLGTSQATLVLGAPSLPAVRRDGDASPAVRATAVLKVEIDFNR